ncbi:Fanconi Anemia Group D2 Protein [Manis pentadactyla]|nr:Fanconi Anemia Group D2 Protein [Manis pentadactyla]
MRGGRCNRRERSRESVLPWIPSAATPLPSFYFYRKFLVTREQFLACQGHKEHSGGTSEAAEERVTAGMEHRPVPTLGEGIATWIQKLENEMALPQHSLRPCVYLYVQMLTHTHTLTWHT